MKLIRFITFHLSGEGKDKMLQILLHAGNGAGTQRKKIKEYEVNSI
jgi:hypothetical protein